MPNRILLKIAALLLLVAPRLPGLMNIMRRPYSLLATRRLVLKDDRSMYAFSRRGFVYGGLALGFALGGCSRSETTTQLTAERRGAGAKAMTVYRDPNCGCCEAWAKIAEDNGYHVAMLDDPDMAAVKQRLGVPPQLASCHTALVGEYVIEGHVPLDQVARLLRERPSDIRGIAVPGMPIGSPGMEVPDGTMEPFQVIAFHQNGQTSVFTS